MLDIAVAIYAIAFDIVVTFAYICKEITRLYRRSGLGEITRLLSLQYSLLSLTRDQTYFPRGNELYIASFEAHCWIIFLMSGIFVIILDINSKISTILTAYLMIFYE